MKKVLLDTNAYTALLRGSLTILEILAEAEIVYMSVIVLGELYAGFNGGNKKSENFRLLSNFLNKPTVEIININDETARIFGEIKNNLKIEGNPIPINDVWISAQAIENGAVLISYDKHFKQIPGIRISP